MTADVSTAPLRSRSLAAVCTFAKYYTGEQLKEDAMDGGGRKNGREEK
jgi:hypothetical protein